MNAQQKSFMLLPDFSFLPGKDLTLGRILPTSKATKSPDARRPLSVRIPVTEDRISSQDSKPWVWDSDDKTLTSAGVTADLSLVTGIGAGFDAQHSKTNGLKLSSSHVKQLTFYPSVEDLTEIVTDGLISKMLAMRDRPAVYLITGLMVADGADIVVKHGTEREGKAHVSADLTSVGAPLNTGVHGGATQAHNESNTKTVKGEFLLAYQLVRLRRKFLSKAVEDRLETKAALFSGEVAEEGAEALLGFDIGIVGPDEFETEADATGDEKSQ